MRSSVALLLSRLHVLCSKRVQWPEEADRPLAPSELRCLMRVPRSLTSIPTAESQMRLLLGIVVTRSALHRLLLQPNRGLGVADSQLALGDSTASKNLRARTRIQPEAPHNCCCAADTRIQPEAPHNCCCSAVSTASLYPAHC